ncbi:TPA: hypothetical protein U1C36_002152 [Streptococcus suis]|nr:hypothetical protein [Streptococcus suis]
MVYFIFRVSLFYLLNEIISVSILSSIIAILFAFWINDIFVFKSLNCQIKLDFFK